jgi:hypothetical protein
MLFYACFAEISALFSPVGHFVSRKSLSLRQAARVCSTVRVSFQLLMNQIPPSLFSTWIASVSVAPMSSLSVIHNCSVALHLKEVGLSGLFISLILALLVKFAWKPVALLSRRFHNSTGLS